MRLVGRGDHLGRGRRPGGPEMTSADHRGRAWLETREFDTHPSTLARISLGVTIIPDAPSYRSR